MNLRDAIDQYIAWRQLNGAKYKRETVLFNLFLKHADGDASCDAVTSEQAEAFLAGTRPLTAYRSNKYSLLSGFYRYAIGRGYASCSPLRDNEPRKPPYARPYVYSHDELRRLFGAIDASRQNAVQLDARTFRTLLLVLYGAGLRLGEACNLRLIDVDLSEAVLTVHDGKFYKSRLVPVGPQLADALRSYETVRTARPLPEGKASRFLANRNGTPLCHVTVREALVGLLHNAGISRQVSPGQQPPRLHSFRHSFAVHRLTSWYRQGADVQRLLPVLSTYMGHKDLSGTQTYLTMTPELLQQASLRLESHMKGIDDEE